MSCVSCEEERQDDLLGHARRMFECEPVEGLCGGGHQQSLKVNASGTGECGSGSGEIQRRWRPWSVCSTKKISDSRGAEKCNRSALPAKVTSRDISTRSR